MPLFDLPLDVLRGYRPARHEPADFDAFWRDTLADATPIDPVFTAKPTGLALVQVEDVRFTGFGGQRVAGWLLTPADAAEPLPTVVHYIGYGGGRGRPHEWLTWPCAGYALLVMDTRGQGDGDTPDPDGGSNPQPPGFLTRGVLDRERYYYRRVFTDAVRAVDAAAAHPLVDAANIAVAGGSQGGAISQAVAGLRPGLRGALVDVPFLTHIRRATEITDERPYQELVEFCARNRDRVEQAFTVLSYFDGMNFAARATVPALYSVGLMDPICPPSTVFAAFNHYAGPADIQIWPYNEHEGGASAQQEIQLRWVGDLPLH